MKTPVNFHETKQTKRVNFYAGALAFSNSERIFVALAFSHFVPYVVTPD